MATDHRCRWVRYRLPLLAGGELRVEERRRVERHLIGCPGCRDRREASEGALSVLQLVAREHSARPDTPSLWPALARQIRESRHAAPRRLSWWASASTRLEPGLWPGLGLAMGLGLVAATMPPGRVTPLPPPTPAVEVVAVDPPAVPSAVPVSPALPEVPDRTLTQNGLKPIEPPSTLRVDYDLDHGTPMGPGSRDPQRSY